MFFLEEPFLSKQRSRSFFDEATICSKTASALLKKPIMRSRVKHLLNLMRERMTLVNSVVTV